MVYTCIVYDKVIVISIYDVGTIVILKVNIYKEIIQLYQRQTSSPFFMSSTHGKILKKKRVCPFKLMFAQDGGIGVQCSAGAVAETCSSFSFLFLHNLGCGSGF